MLDGIHHVTAITGDAAAHARFHTGVLGLRLVKTTVNHDEPGQYHLYYGDETGRPRTLLTAFEIPGTPPGQPGGGMFNSIAWRVADELSLDFWQERLTAYGTSVTREDGRLRFTDPEGLSYVLRAKGARDDDTPAHAEGIPQQHALREIIGVEAMSLAPDRTRTAFVEGLGMADLGDTLVAGSGDHVARVALHPEPMSRGMQGGGTIHHVAFGCRDGDDKRWRDRMAQAHLVPTQVVDRVYFRSIYAREPGGLLVEVSTYGPGCAVDEDPETMGTALMLPPWLEEHRMAIEARLTPIAPSRGAV